MTAASLWVEGWSALRVADRMVGVCDGCAAPVTRGQLFRSELASDRVRHVACDDDAD